MFSRKEVMEVYDEDGNKIVPFNTTFFGKADNGISYIGKAFDNLTDQIIDAAKGYTIDMKIDIANTEDPITMTLNKK